jgi:hypothetical protein
MVITILNALIAIPKIVGYVEQFASQVTLWWVQRQTTATLSQIADAAALAAHAQTDGDRYAASQAWEKALSNPRVSA